MLTIRMLGALAAEHDGAPVELPPGGRAAALLAWLALHPGRHPRSRLAACFWPEAPEASARASLRSAVWALRASLGPDADRYLAADRDRVGLTGENLHVDVLEFDESAAAGRLDEALALCRGELLAGFDDDWAWQARDEHAERLSRVLDEAIKQAEERGDVGAALATARRRAELLPFEAAAAAAPVEPPRAMIGRDVEFRRLTALWHGTHGGRGQVALITGEGGIGKTRMCEELQALAEGSGAAVATATAGIGSAPLAVWSEALGTLAADLGLLGSGSPWAEPRRNGPGGLDPDLTRAQPRRSGPGRVESDPTRAQSYLNGPGGLDPDLPWADLARIIPAAAPAARPTVRAEPQLMRIRLFEAVVALLARAVRDRPLLLVLEDLHAADPSSLELLAHVSRRIGRLPVLILLTGRPGVPRPDLAPGTRIALELGLRALSPAQIRGVTATVAELPEPDVDRIVEVAAGSPLIAVEAALACARGEDPARSLREAVHVATARLSPPARLVVGLLAVAGRDVARSEVLAFPIGQPERALSEALGADLLRVRAGTIGFRHALLAEAVYADLNEATRIRLHDAFADLLGRGAAGPAGGRRAAETARHLQLAGRGQQAVGQLVRAASEARAVAALAEAAGFLREACAVDPHDPALFLELAEIEAWRGAADESDAAFAEALRLIRASDRGALAEAWLRRGRWMRGGLCYPRESMRSYRSALDLLDRDDGGSGRAEALAGLAWCEAVAGDPERVEPMLAEVAAAVGRAEASNDLLTHDIGVARAHALLRAGKFEDSYAPLIAAAAAASRAGHPDMAYGCLMNAACAAAAIGDPERALDFTDRALAQVEPHGLLRLGVYVLSARAAVQRRLGRLADADASCDAESALAERVGQPDLEGLARFDRGLLATARSDHEASAEHIAAALALGAPVSRPHARLCRAEALARADRLAEAEAEIRATALEPVAAGDFPDTLVARMNRVQGLVAARRGETEAARRHFDAAAALWRRRTGVGSGDQYSAALIDLGRPPMSSLTEPDEELAAIAADRAALDGADDVPDPTSVSAPDDPER